MRWFTGPRSSERSSPPSVPSAWFGSRSTRPRPLSWGWWWRVTFAVGVVVLYCLNARAEWLAHLAYSTASLSASERCPRLTIRDCYRMDAAAQTYMQLLAAANAFPLDRNIRWSPEQFVVRYRIIEQRAKGKAR